jgi:acetyl-CoA acetyltransferase
MDPFAKPGAAKTYDEMGAGAVEAVLADSGLPYDKIQQVYAGYVYGDSTCGQRVVHRFGMTKIPVLNVNNNCASGSSAPWLARQAVESGAAPRHSAEAAGAICLLRTQEANYISAQVVTVSGGSR